MKKILNISLILLMVVLLFGSVNCKNVHRHRGRCAISKGPAPPERLLPVAAHKPRIARAVRPAPPCARPKPPVVVESDQIIVSRIYPAPEFAIIKMDKTMPREVEVNKPFNYFIKVTNLTETTLTNVVVTEELPKNFKFTSSDPPAKENATNLVWGLNSLEPKTSEQIMVSGMATSTDTLKLATTAVTHFVPVLGNIRVVQPKLELTKTAPAQVVLCDTIPVQFAVANSGTGSARNVKLASTLPEGLQDIDGKNELVFDAGTLPAGHPRQFSANLRATKTGTFVCKTVASATGLQDVSQEITITVGQPMLLVKKDGPEKQYVGRPVIYEITVTNKGDAPARNAVVEDTIPQGVTSLKVTAGAKLSQSRRVVWQLGTLEPEASKQVRVSYIPTKIGTLTDKTTATAYCTEGVTASTETSVAGISGVLLEVIDMEDPVEVGNTTTYEITVTNQGSAAATGIQITCGLEDNVRYVSSSGATTGLLEGNILRFAPLSSLSAGDKAVWRVVAEALKPADTRFRATMTADQLTRPVEETEATHLYK